MEVLYTKFLVAKKDQSITFSFLRKFDTELQTQHDKSIALDDLYYVTSCPAGWENNSQNPSKYSLDTITYDCVLNNYKHYTSTSLDSTLDTYIENYKAAGIEMVDSFDVF